MLFSPENPAISRGLFLRLILMYSNGLMLSRDDILTPLTKVPNDLLRPLLAENKPAQYSNHLPLGVSRGARTQTEGLGGRRLQMHHGSGVIGVF